MDCAIATTHPDIEQPLELNLKKFVHPLYGHMHLVGMVQQSGQQSKEFTRSWGMVLCYRLNKR